MLGEQLLMFQRIVGPFKIEKYLPSYMVACPTRPESSSAVL